MKSLLFLAVFAAVFATAQSSPHRKESPVSHRATGTFDVKLAPMEPYNKDDKTLGRFSVDKQYHGNLDATGKGEMLSVGTGAPGTSGGIVGIEKVTGKLNGRSGTFVLQHNATMTRGKPEMNVIVVPDSGTGELAGISGKLEIVIEGGKHSYVFDYTLPAKP